MIIKKKLDDGKRSASAWQGYESVIYFGVTDHDRCLGRIGTDNNGDTVIYIFNTDCKEANVKIKFVD